MKDEGGKFPLFILHPSAFILYFTVSVVGASVDVTLGL